MASGELMQSADSSDYSDYTDLSIQFADPNVRRREYEEFLDRARWIHASYLFFRDRKGNDPAVELCVEIYRGLVRRIGATMQTINSMGWKDLACHLEIDGEQVNYIDNLKTCPTTTLLKVFCQDDDATFQKIIIALIKMNRLDVVEAIFDPLKHLAKILIEENIPENIIRPSGFINDLPEVLRKDKKEDISPVPSDPAGPTINEPSVLLTYYDDGLTTANKINDALSKITINKNRIQVILLEYERHNILQNPHHYIQEYVDKVNFVIPVLSEGYMKKIISTSELCNSSLDNIDCTHVRYVYDLLSNSYVNGTGCLNKKVRGVVTSDLTPSIHKTIGKFPILKTWIREDQIDNLGTFLFPPKKK